MRSLHSNRRRFPPHSTENVARRKGTTAAALALALTASLVACGGGDGALSDQAAADLGAGVARVRAAAAAGDRTGAGRELAALRGAVDRYRGQDQISAGRAADVLAAAGEVEARLALLVPPAAPTTTTTNTTTTSTTTTVRQAPADRGKDDKGKGDEGDGGGRGGGRGKEDDD